MPIPATASVEYAAMIRLRAVFETVAIIEIIKLGRPTESTSAGMCCVKV